MSKSSSSSLEIDRENKSAKAAVASVSAVVGLFVEDTMLIGDECGIAAAVVMAILSGVELVTLENEPASETDTDVVGIS